MANNNDKGNMSVGEAGQRGGEKTSQTHGREHYENIGKKGGERVSDLIDKGKQVEGSE